MKLIFIEFPPKNLIHSPPRQLTSKSKYFPRFILIQTTIVLSLLFFAEYTNCLMYIGPTSINFDNACMALCIIPLLTTAMLECRLFAYFLLMKERLRVINKSIEFYTNNLHSFLTVVESHNANDDRMNGIRSKIFFITELGSHKINDQVKRKKTVNGGNWKSNFAVKLKSTTWSCWRFIKNLLNVRKNKIFVDDFEAYKNAIVEKNNFDLESCIRHVGCMQIIYSKLHEISDLISKAYGIQIISIISVQFVTLTTLMYYSTMKIIRWEFVNELICHGKSETRELRYGHWYVH